MALLRPLQAALNHVQQYLGVKHFYLFLGHQGSMGAGIGRTVVNGFGSLMNWYGPN
jgi:hypothetical protein